ncbi:hypothetical protein EG19_10945 [Thermoanaerobaculum aquaticum]|uniref:Uncharacterized protein n=1 Tax=Thermoanaerobaculum aquaticum TaxID=1312852 RepID=A0A062XPH3_9BACT|nr:hypothetical protein [Thermoanaerobaculum aquaticum]KDA54482.1 hypothetical protein EG19_10945 [Thermoanaerobaculum aquaticum]
MASRTVKIGCVFLALLVIGLIAELPPRSGVAILDAGVDVAQVPVFTRPELIDEVVRADDSRVTGVLLVMQLKGEVFYVDQGCEVAVVGSTRNRRKVQILCPGPVFGMTGWVPALWVK